MFEMGKSYTSCFLCQKSLLNDPSSRSSYSRVSRGPSPKNQMGGGRDGNQVRKMTLKQSEQHQGLTVFSKAQGLNAQAKGEVLLSRRNGAVEKEEVLLSRSDGAAEIFLLAATLEAGTWWYQGVVRTSVMTQGQNIPWFSESMCPWPALDPFFFSVGEAQFRDQELS